MGQLTKQEMMFFDRVALKIVEDPALTIEAAAKKVLEDDTRTMNKVFRLREDESKALIHGMADIVYHAIRSKEAV